LVGGAVRDLLAGRGAEGADWDVATSALPAAVIALFPRVVETGIAHGTVTVVDAVTGIHVQVTTYRTEGAYRDGRRPESVEFVRSIEEDLARRDFTMNAIAFDTESGAVVDPFGGQDDLRDGILRAVGDPLERFAEDGLRALRAARFAAVLGARIDDATLRAIPKTLSTFRRIAVERVRAELEKLVCAARASRGLRALEETGLLREILPELSLLAPTLRARAFERVERAPFPFSTRMAALLWDLGERVAADAFERLRPSRSDLLRLSALLRGALRLGAAHATDADVRRALSSVGRDDLPDALALLEAHLAVARAGDEALQNLRHVEGVWRDVKERGLLLELAELPVDGRDVESALGVTGPEVGRVLRALLDHVLEAPEHASREALLQHLREHTAPGGIRPKD
jgi:tRNA nucleotidyltransferase (CCA-adding enzyme)